MPICREFALPKEGSTVFFDLLGVTAHGRLVLIECKLWRNPQARREVIAQILEYAALLGHWTYADLTSRLKSVLGRSSANPIYEHVRRRLPQVDEARFVDMVSRSLQHADFDLLVAGDGIRSDVQAIATHLARHSGLAARLALIEFQLWSDASGRTVVVPSVPLRTEVIQHRVIVGSDGAPLRVQTGSEETDDTEATVDPERAAQRERNRAFWQRFIETVTFDHPDQAPPRHGGNNWVQMDLPYPGAALVAYRYKGAPGLFLRLLKEPGRIAFDTLEAESASLRDDAGFEVVFKREREEPFKGSARFILPNRQPGSEEESLAVLRDSANRVVNALRPKLSALARNALQ